MKSNFTNINFLASMGRMVGSSAILRGFFYPMAKDPAFLFYTSDFLTGTVFLTNEQVGLYIRMLCIQHQHGGRIDTNVLRTQCAGITGGDSILQKFMHDEYGSYNLRLDLEIKKRKERSIKASESVNKRWKKTTKKTKYDSNTNVLRSENENENENEDKNTLEGGLGGDWKSTKNSFLNSDQWMYQFCTSKNISRENLSLKMNEFLNDMELRNEYKDLKELQRHFTNWFNKSKNAKPTTKTQLRQSILNDRLRDLPSDEDLKAIGLL